MTKKSISIIPTLLTIITLFSTGCATSSSLSTTDVNYQSTPHTEIRILTEYPESYESIGLVEASAPKGYLRKPEHATKLALAALKKQAAKLGAHAVVLKDYSSSRVPDFSLAGGSDDLGLIFNTEHKQVTAVAIRLL